MYYYDCYSPENRGIIDKDRGQIKGERERQKERENKKRNEGEKKRRKY